MRYTSAREKVMARVQPPRKPEGLEPYLRAAREFEALRARIEGTGCKERLDERKGRDVWAYVQSAQKNRPLQCPTRAC